MTTDPYDPPKTKQKNNLTNKLDLIAETLGMIAITLVFLTVFGLTALWRILHELQRG